MASVSLSDNAVYPWLKQGNFWVKGNTKAAPKSIQLKDAQAYQLANVCGFAWVYEDEQIIAAATDNIRSFPIFYSLIEGELTLSDSAYEIRKEKKLTALNKPAFPAFRELGYVPGNETLVKDIKVLQCNELLTFNKKEKKVSVISYASNTVPTKRRLENVLETIFKDLVASLNGRTAVIPLSGGWDSRLILAALKKYNYPKILCYTYGKEDSYEVSTASRIAKTLQVDWHFVEYTDAIFENYLSASGENYERNASQLSAIAHEQDFFALQYLTSKKLLPEDSVFVPGFCADVPAGSQVLHEDSVAAYSDFHAFAMHRITKNKRLLERNENDGNFLRNTLRTFDSDKPAEWQGNYELWLQNNRLSKFITNSVRCFEHFGFQWQLPFWHHAFTSFWKAASYEERYQKKLYQQVIFQNYFEPLKINFNTELAEQKMADSFLSQKLKNMAPEAVKNVVKKVLTPKSQQNVNNLEGFVQVLKNSHPGLIEKYDNENQVHAHWYLLHLQDGKETFLYRTTN